MNFIRLAAIEGNTENTPLLNFQYFFCFFRVRRTFLDCFVGNKKRGEVSGMKYNAQKYQLNTEVML